MLHTFVVSMNKNKSTRTAGEDAVEDAAADAAAAWCQCGAERADSAEGECPAAAERSPLCFPTGPQRTARAGRFPLWTVC